MKWKDINIQFGNILRKVREGRNMTQEEFAAFCGVSRAYYGRIERGEHSVTFVGEAIIIKTWMAVLPVYLNKMSRMTKENDYEQSRESHPDL